MEIRTRRSTPLENGLEQGRDVIITLRSRAEDLAERGFASATTAAEHAGRQAAKAGQQAARSVSKRSKSLARSFRDHMPGHHATSLTTLPVARFARRHPVFLVAVGLTAVAVGYLAWRVQNGAEDEAETEHG